MDTSSDSIFVAGNWPYFVSSFYALLLIIIVMALIFNTGFRKDLLSKENKTNIRIFNIRIESTFILVICGGILLLGAVLPIIVSIIREPAEISTDKNKEKLKEKPNDTNIGQETEKKDLKNSILITELPEYIRNLPHPSDDSEDAKLSQKIIKIQKKRMGPWRNPTDQKIIESVPGNVQKGEANVCPEHRDSSFRLYQNEKIVTVTAVATIYQIENCRELSNVDMQVSCHDANILFGDDTLTCGSDGSAKWKVTVHRISLFAAEN